MLEFLTQVVDSLPTYHLPAARALLARVRAVAVSRPCDHCGKAKRCEIYYESGPKQAGLSMVNYLCRPCARELGYIEA